MKTIIAIAVAGMIIIGVEKVFFTPSELSSQCKTVSEKTQQDLLRSCAEAGNSDAQYLVFTHFDTSTKGYGTSEEEAVNWLLQAEKGGHLKAKLHLMRLYRGGWVQKYEAIPRNSGKSDALARELALQGVAEAQWQYGFFVVPKRNPPSSQVQGHRWVIEAANNGNRTAKDDIRKWGGTGADFYIKAMALKEHEWKN